MTSKPQTEASQLGLFQHPSDHHPTDSLRPRARRFPAEDVPLSRAFVPAVFVYIPLPYRDPGKEYDKSVNGYTVHLTSRFGCPYGKIGRSVLSLITTQAVITKSPIIEIGSLRSALAKMILSSSGGKRGSFNAALDQLLRISNTLLTLSRPVRGAFTEGLDEIRFALAAADSFRWSALNPDGPILPNNALQLTAEFLAYIRAHAVPTILEIYCAIQSPRQQDLLVWLSRRFRTVTNEDGQLVPWDCLYEQFGPVSRSYKPLFREEITDYLTEIVTVIYPRAKRTARVKIRPEGVELFPSPPLVEPDDKRAGHLV